MALYDLAVVLLPVGPLRSLPDIIEVFRLFFVFNLVGCCCCCRWFVGHARRFCRALKGTVLLPFLLSLSLISCSLLQPLNAIIYTCFSFFCFASFTDLDHHAYIYI
ncbi:hypothetical protein ACOSQ2_024555 [Xanthoceras sorbifolium]